MKNTFFIDLSNEIVHVLCTCGNNSTKRFRDGILHLISKALPQRSVIKTCDRASVDFVRTQPRTRALLDACAPGLSIQNNFTQILQKLREIIAANLRNNPALYSFANKFFCAHTLCTEYKLKKKNTPWTLHNFMQCLKAMLPTPPSSAVHLLHVAFSLQSEDVEPRDVFEDALLSCRVIKRRLRKAALRKVVAQLDAIALAVRVRAFLRYKCLFTSYMPMQAENSRIFYACSNCNTHRSTENGFGANRVLYCSLSNVLTCGKKYDSHCQHTVLTQVSLANRVVHMLGKGSFAQCAQCECIFKYGTAKTWRKGVMCCPQCYHSLTACVDAPCCSSAPPPTVSGTAVVRKACTKCKARAQVEGASGEASGAVEQNPSAARIAYES